MSMTRSSQHREKHVTRSEHSRDNGNEGTAARTRPFSFDEIISRRKKKKQSGDDEARHGEAINTSVKDIAEKVSNRSEKVSNRSDSGRGYVKNELLSVIVKHSSDDFVKVNSRRKEEDISTREDKFVKRKDKGSRDSETKSKVSLSMGVGDKAQGWKDDRRGHDRKTNDERSRVDFKNGSENRRARDLIGKERYADRSRGETEKENKRKYRNEDDERSREKNTFKKLDLGQRHDSIIAERKERKESSEFHNEESRSKKRWPRSRERDKDISRKSLSPSPRSHKRTSYNVREHGDLSSHSSKDRSKRPPPDDERNKISNNGSSSHHRRHGESPSGLGGYSPRKRRTDVAVKTPSPPPRSPEKRSAGWDLPPAREEVNATGSVFSNVQSANQTASSNIFGLSGVASASSPTVRPLSGVFQNAAIDSIQLTQATRPMRRLYVENLPASASEKALMESLNYFLLASGINHIQVAQPCISCIINKEKGQALVEFLTPEDASAALSLDGRSFSGSILKIRRPKDYVEVAVRRTGVPDKSIAAFDTKSRTEFLTRLMPAFDSTSDAVRDSPQKIFIGGISKAISSDMLREITSAFGPLKAFHFEVDAHLNEPRAFLEFVDQSVTLKACAGLNGMRLGGQILTVVLATPDASSLENIGDSPFYGIPEHAKPLLKKPTPVLKLKNVLDPEVLSSLSEPELEEVLEDIRLECSRFGTVKSVNVVKCSECQITLEKCEIVDETHFPSIGHDLNNNKNLEAETSGERIDSDAQKNCISEATNHVPKPKEADKAVENDGACGDKLTADLTEDEIPTCIDNSDSISRELEDDKVDVDAGTENKSTVEEKLESEEADEKLMEALAEMNFSERMDSGAVEKSESRERVSDLENVFEPGCVLVEYKRIEASSVAAHYLHGRLFDNRNLSVEYIAYDVYQERFPK